MPSKPITFIAGMILGSSLLATIAHATENPLWMTNVNNILVNHTGYLFAQTLPPDPCFPPDPCVAHPTLRSSPVANQFQVTRVNNGATTLLRTITAPATEGATPVTLQVFDTADLTIVDANGNPATLCSASR